jgi:ABC-type sugar transport system permease subunit
MPNNRSTSIELNRARLRAKFFQKSKLFLALYLLVLPTTLSLLVFSYYPKVDVVVKSLYRWQPPTILEFVGLGNFLEAFNDPLFWYSFQLVGILLLANLVKLIPGILVAIAIHRVESDRLRYFFQACFVVPMIIPGMVALLIWKSFYDPDFGLVNRLLSATGGMELLAWLDRVMPALSGKLQPLLGGFVSPVFGGMGGLILIGAFIIAFGGRSERDRSRFFDFGLILAGAFLMPLAALLGLDQTPAGWSFIFIAALLWMVGMARRLGGSWIAWPFLILGGTVLFWDQLWRLPVVVLIGMAAFEAVRSRRDHYLGRPLMNYIGFAFIAAGALLILMAGIWKAPTNQFDFGTPAWLGNENLVIPALLFWGFPWVGTIGVLIYLSGLQNISQDVYEAAKLDGVGPLGMIFHIELPLIMTQVRINMIFMTIGTLVSYEIFLILLGPDGGPGNKGMVPGLYMFSSAFAEGRFGYACALGMVLFVIILLLTIIYQKYVKVDK